MKKLSLQIAQDANYEFFLHYDKLGKIQKKIWQLAVWYSKRYPLAFPKQEKIANRLDCSRKHVNRTFSLFQRLGWMTLISRGPRQTKGLCICDHLLQVDVVKREYFKRVEVTSKVTHSYSRGSYLTSKPGEKVTRPFEKLEPSLLGQKAGFSNDGCLKMALYPESLQHEAGRICHNLAKNGWRPDVSEERYYLGTLHEIAKKYGHKPKWSLFYQKKREYEKLG